MHLRPSKIRFCQDSISGVWNKKSEHPGIKIGETLDDLLRGWCDISDIPTITVVNENGVWYTLDNRRLWVFRKLEELGHCKKIPVIEDDCIDSEKFTTNGGRSIDVRQDPGGYYWKLCSDDQSSNEHFRSDDENSYGSSNEDSDVEEFTEDEYSQEEYSNKESDGEFSYEASDDDQSSDGHFSDDENCDEYSNGENSDGSSNEDYDVEKFSEDEYSQEESVNGEYSDNEYSSKESDDDFSSENSDDD